VETSEYKPPKEYDLWAINWKTPYIGNDASNLTGNPWLAEIYAKDPWESVILLNPVTAQRKRLDEGARIVVESRYGKIEGRLRISELFHPDAVGVGGSYGLGTRQSSPLNRLGPNFNALLSLEDKTLDGVSGGQDTAPAVKIYREEVKL
jgi:anaerobic selenocysteine-containing dehydrogenase